MFEVWVVLAWEDIMDGWTGCLLLAGTCGVVTGKK